MVNGKMQARSVLQDGDELTIGGTLLKFQCVGDQPHNYAIPEVKSLSAGKIVLVIVIIAAIVVGGYFSGLIG